MTYLVLLAQVKSGCRKCEDGNEQEDLREELHRVCVRAEAAAASESHKRRRGCDGSKGPGS